MSTIIARRLLALTCLGLTLSCASSPARPFDTLKDSQVSALRLQNYEPPEGQQSAQSLPQQIQQWVQAGAQGLEPLIPPGLLPPGTLQGIANATGQAMQPPLQTPRFHSFRILGQQGVISPRLKDELAELFGNEDNFQEQHLGCLYPEMGLSFYVTANTTPNDILISFSCKQVAAVTFPWPHGNKTGMTPDMVKELTSLVQQIWPTTGG